MPFKELDRYSCVDRKHCPEIVTYLTPRKRRAKHLLQPRDGLELFDFMASGRKKEVPLLNSYPQILSEDFGRKRIFHTYFDGKIWRAVDSIYVSRPLEHRQADEYWDEVTRLGKTPAGKKSQELLESFLNEHQRDEIEKYGGFAETFEEWELVERPGVRSTYEVTRSQGLWVFIIGPRGPHTLYKYWPPDKSKEEELSFCWHPDEPLPAADIALAHYLFIKNNGGNAFLKQANW